VNSGKAVEQEMKTIDDDVVTADEHLGTGATVRVSR
jgi:hypothetical protein